MEVNKFYEIKPVDSTRDCKLFYRSNNGIWDEKHLSIDENNKVTPFTLKTATGKVKVSFKDMQVRSIDIEKILRACFIKFTGVFPHIKCTAVSKIMPWKKEGEISISTKV